MARKKISFDPADPELRKVIQEIADELGIPPGDVMNLFTLDALERFSNGEIEIGSMLRSSEYPRYKNRLDLSSYLDRFRKKRGK